MTEVHNIPAGSRDREEEALVKGLAESSPHHVGEFLKRTHRPVYAMAARLTFDPDLRHDWSQDILLKIIKEMATGRFVYQRPGCFWAWFQMRTNFLLISQYHQHKKQRDRWTTGEIGAALLEKMPLDDSVNPLQLLEAVEARRVVEECLEQLASADQRQALNLVLFHGQAYQEVADTMGATLNTVRSWVRRARIAVRCCVAGKLDFPGCDDS